MWKIIIWTIVVILLAFMGIAYYFDARGHVLISDYLSKELGAQVKVEHATLNWNSLSLEDVTIRHPEERSPLVDSLTIKHVVANFELLSVFHPVVHFTEVVIDTPTINVDLYNASGSDNNWNAFFADSDDATSKKETKSEPKEEKTVIVDTLILKSITLRVHAKALGNTAVTLPPLGSITIHNLNSNTPLEVDSEIRLVLRTMLAILRNAVGQEHAAELLGTTPSELSDIWPQIDLQLSSQKESSWKEWWNGVQSDVKEGWGDVKEWFQNLVPQKD